MRKIRTSGLKGHHQLKEFTIIEWKFTTQEYKPIVQKIGRCWWNLVRKKKIWKSNSNIKWGNKKIINKYLKIFKIDKESYFVTKDINEFF